MIETPIRPVRALIVEDDADDFFLFSAVLRAVEGMEFSIARARTFDEGLAAITAGGYDVCFVDFRLGAHDGIELLKVAFKAGARGPFIILTGIGDHRTDVEAMRAGAADFLVKDRAKPDIVERAVRYALERERVSRELRAAREELEARVAERTKELVTAREAAERLYEDASQANRLKDEFLATLSHELRTPLNAITGYTELMLDGAYADPDELRSWLEVVHRNAHTQSRLIEDLLEVSRIITGKLRIQLELVDFARLVADAVHGFGKLAGEAGLDLTVALPDGALSVLGDRVRLEQVVTNLVSNALKFTPRGGRVRVSLGRDSEKQLRLTVSDDGQGIDAAFLPYVFDRFRQEDGRLVRTHGGLGLGLALVRHFVESHGGKVVAESSGPGLGATFTVTLPVEAAAPAPPRAAPTAPALDSRRLAALRILVIDDSSDVRRFVSTVLRRSGGEPLTAASVAEARDLLATHDIDVILCDIGMPGESGYDFIRELRQGRIGARHASIPAAAFTAYAHEQEKQRGIEAGYDGYLTKPMQARSLVDAVAALASR
jgi:signal transduction histidine kinase